MVQLSNFNLLGDRTSVSFIIAPCCHQNKKMSQRNQGSILDSLGQNLGFGGGGLSRQSSNLSQKSFMGSPGQRRTVLGRGLGRMSQALFGRKNNTATVDHLFIDEQNLYKKDMQKLLKYLEMVATDEMNMTTEEIVESIQKFGRIAHLGGPSTTRG